MIENEILIKLLAVYNKEKYCLAVFIKGNKRVYDLYLMRDKVSDFLKEDNKPILSSDFEDTVEELISYLKKHDGFVKEW